MNGTQAGTAKLFVPGGPERMFRVAPITESGGIWHASMMTGSWATGPDGQPSAGSVGVLADVALGWPVVVAGGDSRWAVSIELTVDFCAPLPQGGQPLRSESSVTSLSPSGGLTQARFTGADGSLVAVGTQRMRFTPAGGAWPAPGAPPAGFPREADALGQLGASLTRTPAGATLALPGGGTLVNPMGNLHGGILFCASELVGQAAVQSGDYPLTTASVTITFLRPGPAAGQTVFEASTVHRGRTLAVAHVTSRNAAGKICTVATVTSHRGD